MSMSDQNDPLSKDGTAQSMMACRVHEFRPPDAQVAQ